MPIPRMVRFASLAAALTVGGLATSATPAISGEYPYGDCGAGDCNAPYGYDGSYRYDDGRNYDGYYGRTAGYDRGYYGNGYGRDVVCDPDGDRCYHSYNGCWDFHEYYRLHGYHWEN